MAKTRKKKAPASPFPFEVDEEAAEPQAAAPKNGHGGYRAGAGRKPTLGKTMDAGIYISCSADQKEALAAHVEALSAKREAAGLPKVDLSTWVRELALKHSGNEHLGLAAQAKARAAAAESLV